jgi:hypothetical protein
MKKLLVIAFVIVEMCCRGQTPVIPLLEEDPLTVIEGAYYKDVNNELNKFAGTWKYTGPNNTSFTIVLQKKVMVKHPYENHYEDILVGEYKYVSNGVELINTLPNLNTNFANYYKYNITGVIITDRDQGPADRRVILSFDDPEREYLSYRIFVKCIFGGSGIDKIETKFDSHGSVIVDDSPATMRVPEQNYILTKQP